MKHLRLALVVAFAAFLFAEGAEAKPDYLKHYEAALEAVDDEEWDEAVDLLERALRNRDEEAKRLRRWFFFQPYVPYFYYGVAKYNQGDCETALESFEASEDQGVLETQEGLYDHMLELREACESGESPSRPSDDEPRDESESTQNTEPPPPPKAERQRSQSDSRATQSTKSRPRRDPAPEPEVDDTPPPELDQAIDLFFSGDSARALALLESIDGGQPKVKAHVRLLRAAAAYRLFLLSAETDHVLLDKALRYLQEYRDVGYPITPPRSLFGPRFLGFFLSGE